MIKKVLQNRDFKTLRNNFVSLLLDRAFNILIPIILLPYLIKTVGVNNYGVYAFILSIIFYLFYISQYGFSLSAVKEISKVQNDIDKVSVIFYRVFFTKLVILLCTAFILIIVILSLEEARNNLFLVLTTYLIVIGDVLNPVWLFQGMEKMKYLTIVNVISKSTFLIFVLLFVKEKEDYIYIGLYQGMGFFLGGIISFLIALKLFNLKYEKTTLHDVSMQLKTGASSFVTLIVPMLYVNTSTFLLGLFGAPAQVTYFDSAYKISNGFSSLNQVLTNVFYPYVNRKGNQFILVSSVLISIGCILSLICFLLSKLIINLLFGSEMESSILLLKILSLTPLFLSIRSAFGINYLLVKNKDRLYMNIAFFSSILAFILGLFLIKNFESLGAAIVVVFAQGIYSILSMYFAIKIINRNKFLINGK